MADRTCTIDRCDRKHYGRGVCQLHYDRILNEATTVPVTYHRAHRLLEAERGPARRNTCIDCGKPAREWSYDHKDPNEVRTRTGARYSLDPKHYDPRCRRCHHVFDAEYRRNELRAAAIGLEEQIRHAITERAAARKFKDLEAEDRWDDELERLTAPLIAPDLNVAANG